MSSFIRKICFLVVSIILLAFVLSGCNFTESSADNNTAGKTSPTTPTVTSKGTVVTDAEITWAITTPDETTNVYTSEGVSNSTGKTSTVKPVTTKPIVTVVPTPKSKNKYALYVNKKQNTVNVYTLDANNKYTVPYKVMLCSTGRNNKTPVGSYSISDQYVWRELIGSVYGQYASRFYKSFLFHSVPYLKTDKGTLKGAEYNKLGEQASDGCVRLCVEDAKWIYDNCKKGTTVVVYEDDNPGPLGKPTLTLIPPTSTWDPTDPDVRNPWKLTPVIYTLKGLSNKTIERKSSIDLMAGVYAVDGNGNKVSAAIAVKGSVDTAKTGVYDVEYLLTQADGSVSSASIIVEVTDKTAPVVLGFDYMRFTEEEISGITRSKLLTNVSIKDDGDVISNSKMSLKIEGKDYASSLLKVGINNIDYSVSDESGNIKSGTFVVYIQAKSVTPTETTPTQTTAPSLPPDTDSTG